VLLGDAFVPLAVESAALVARGQAGADAEPQALEVAALATSLALFFVIDSGCGLRVGLPVRLLI
jgi:hypothetical protein